MDIVYPLRNASENDYVELRYSLRSLANIGHDRVIIVGGKPTWIKNIIHIDGKDESKYKVINSLNKILAATKVCSDDFILMNDDIFLLRSQEIEYYHQGNLKENVDRKGPLLNHSKYWNAMKRTAELFENPLDYGLHYPFVLNKEKLSDLIKKYNMNNVYLFRSLYGNEYAVGGRYMKDNKVYVLENLEGDLFVSSSEQFDIDDKFVRVMEGYFPHKSKYEK